jgi:hypothetical protein
MKTRASESGFHFLQDYLRCQKYWMWRYVRKLVPKYPATSLTYGKAIHETLAKFFQDKTINLETTFTECLTSYKDEFADITHFDEKLADGIAVLTRFKDSFIFASWEPVEIEQSYSTVIGDVRFTGRMDLVIRDYNGLIYIVDHKTTKWSIPPLCQTLSVSDQATGYLMLWNANHPHHQQAYGVIYNILRKYKSVIECKTHPVLKTSEDETRFKKEAGYVLREIMHKLSDPDACFPMNTGSCYLYNQPCPYLDLCKGTAYEGLIGLTYKIDEEGETTND